MANITYKSYEIPTDHEHLPSLTGANCGHKINLSGATTIKLTHRPANVQVWISTESNGTNLYPLINRGDGWVNLPEPLYDLYVFTKGTTPDGEKVLLNYTGQNDFFAYGSNATELVERIGVVEGFSKKALRQKAARDRQLYAPIITENIALRLDLGNLGTIDTDQQKYCAFLLNERGEISQLGLDNSKLYLLDFFGHLDIGSQERYSEGGVAGSGSPYLGISAHISLFNNENAATFTPTTTPPASQGAFAGRFINKINKTPYSTKTKYGKFDIFGTRFERTSGLSFLSANPNFDFGHIFEGSFLNSFAHIGVFFFCNSWVPSSSYVTPELHLTAQMTISEVLDLSAAQ